MRSFFKNFKKSQNKAHLHRMTFWRWTMWRTRRCPGSGCPTIESSPTDSSPSPLTRWHVPNFVAFHSFGPFHQRFDMVHSPESSEWTLRIHKVGIVPSLEGNFCIPLILGKKTVVKACCFYVNFTCGKKRIMHHARSGWGGGPGRISMPGCHQLRWVAASALDIDEVESNFNKNWNDVNLAWCTWYVGSNHWPWNQEFQSRRKVDQRGNDFFVIKEILSE